MLNDRGVKMSSPTMIPPGFIPDASENPTVPGGSNDVKTPLLSKKECPTPAVSLYSPMMSPSAFPFQQM